MHLSSGELWQSFGELCQICAELCQLWQRVTMGSYDHVEDLYKFWKHIDLYFRFGKACQSSPELAPIA